MSATMLRYPGSYSAVHIDAATRAVVAPDAMVRAAFIFAMVQPGPTFASIRYQRTSNVIGETARALSTVGAFPVGAWILVEQTPDESGAGALWQLACVGEWANP